MAQNGGVPNIIEEMPRSHHFPHQNLRPRPGLLKKQGFSSGSQWHTFSPCSLKRTWVASWPKTAGEMLEVLPKNGVHWKHDKTGLGVLKCSEDADKFTWANAVETPMLIFCWPSILVLCASSKGQSSAWSSSKTSAICGENWSWFVQTEGYPNLRPVHC